MRISNWSSDVCSSDLWDATANLKIEADASYAKSWLNPDGQLTSDNADVGYGFGIGPALGIAVNGDSSDTIPELHNYGAEGDPSRWADTSVIGSHGTVRDRKSVVEGKSVSVRVNLGGCRIIK